MTRPTLDKVREAVFSSLGSSFEGGTVLDLYAGSGAVGLEALSRGMDHAIFVDQNKKAVEIIKKNIQTLDVTAQSTVLCMSARLALSHLSSQNIRLDLVYLDPPYKAQENETIITLLQEYHLLNNNCRIVVESLKEDTFPQDIGNVHRKKEAIYGISKISYYRYCSE